MHRRFPILVTLALLSAALPAQTPHTIRIEPLRNEKWWGLFAGGGPAQPFAAPFDSSDCDSCGTFAIPFMISSGGRMMWSSAPADVVFDGSLFTVTPSGTQPTVAKGGRTLREAYLYCVHKYAWPKGTAPARHPFMRPVYDTGLSETPHRRRRYRPARRSRFHYRPRLPARPAAHPGRLAGPLRRGGPRPQSLCLFPRYGG